MKILRIHIRNLNSLRLQTTIDFETAPLVHADIFAITGDTGAGKTTILDAITLALYGKVARDKDAHKEVLSYGATECQAEVEFEVGTERYLAGWRMYRARNKIDGNLLAPQRELAQWDSEQSAFVPIAEKIKEVDEAVKSITKLDFERFTRSVMLAQGDFASFLKANDKDRSDLLERITGTAIYSQLSTAAFERYRIEEQALKNLQEQQSQLGLLSTEPISKKEVEAAKKTAKKANVLLEQKQKEVQALDRWLDAKQQITILGEELTQLESNRNLFSEELQRLQKAKVLNPLYPDFQEWTFKQNQEKQLQLRIESLKLKIEQEKALFTQLAQKVEDSKKVFQETKKQAKEKEEIFRQADRIDEQIKALRTQTDTAKQQDKEANEAYEKLRNDIATVATERETLRAEQKELSDFLTEQDSYKPLAEALPRIEQEREQLRNLYLSKQDLQTQLEKSEAVAKQWEELSKQNEHKYETEEKKLRQLQADFSQLLPAEFAEGEQAGVQRLGAAIMELQEKRQLLQQLHTLDNAYQDLLKEQEVIENRLATLLSHQQNNTKQLLTLLDQREQFQEELAFKQAVYQQQQLIANYKKDRLNLKQGDPCPLCLSTDHPFHSHPVKPFVDKAKAELESVTARFQAALSQERSLLQEEAEVNQEIELLHGNDLSPLTGRIQEQRSKFIAYEEQIAALMQSPGEEWELERGQLLANKLRGIEVKLSKWKIAQEQLGLLSDKINASAKTLQESERKYLDTKEKLSVAKAEMQSISKALETEVTKFQAATVAINKRLEPFGFQFELDSAKATFDKLHLILKQYTAKQERLVEVKQALKINETQNHGLEQALLQQKKVQSAVAGELQKLLARQEELRQKRHLLLGEQETADARVLEEQRLLNAEQNWQQQQKKEQQQKELLATSEQSEKDSTAELQVLQESMETLMLRLTKSLKKLGYSSPDEATPDLLSLEEQEVLEEQKRVLEQNLLQNARATEAAHAEAKKYQPKNTDEGFINLMRTELQELKSEQETALLHLGQLEEKYKQQEQRKEQFQSLLQRIEEQRTAFNRWAELNEIIGQRDGKKFRSFAQGLTLQRLIVLANHHLSRLNGRYLISKKAETDLELEIIDNFQAENRRSMYTLSGGESFLISLALALGLSDLAGRHAQIQSLFIDEGFGTLDEQSLDLAISTLENLQSRGKTIGIISHIAALKDRITVQIHVRKHSNGFSEINVR